MAALSRLNKNQIQDNGHKVTYRAKSIRQRLGSQILTDSPIFFDHFLRYVPTTYTATGPLAVATSGITYTSTGTAVANPTILAVGASNVTGGAGGVLKLTTDDVQNSAEEIATPLMHTIDKGAPLVFETRLKVSGGASNTAREAFFGLADALTYTSGRPYTVTTASAITGTNVPTDFCGFAMSSVPTSGAGFNTDIDGSGTDGTNVGYITSINNTDVFAALKFNTAAGTGVGRFVRDSTGTTGSVNDATAYHTYRIEVDTSGYPTFWVDGMYAGTGASVLTITAPLGAYFDVVSLTASAANTEATMFIDYIYLGASSTWKG